MKLPFWPVWWKIGEIMDCKCSGWIFWAGKRDNISKSHIFISTFSMFKCDQCAKLCQPLQVGCFGGKIGTILFISNLFFYLSLYLSPSFFLQVDIKKESVCLFLKTEISKKHLLLFWCKDSQISFSVRSAKISDVSRQILQCQQLG